MLSQARVLADIAVDSVLWWSCPTSVHASSPSHRICPASSRCQATSFAWSVPLCLCRTEDIYPRAGLYTSLLLLALSFPELSLLPFFLSMILLEKSIYLLPGPIKPIRTTTAPPACSGLPFTYALHAVCTGPFFSKTSPLSSIKKCQRLCNFNLSLLPLMPISKTIHLKQKIQR